MKILVLYTEISTYFLAGVRAFIRDYEGEVKIVRWPVANEAPFKFKDEPGLEFIERKTLSDDALLKFALKYNPDLVYVAGWVDKGYVKVAKAFRKKGKPVVCAMDNQWKATTRQKLAIMASPWVLKPVYSHFWVPGLYQYEYARRLGINRNNIRTGMYTADVAPFQKAWEKYGAAKKEKFPHTFLYVGRYLEIKGVIELVKGFIRFKELMPSDWKLQMIGGGPLKEELPRHEDIIFGDFVQPDELPDLVKDAGVFVLPSRSDAWGVVLHEFAAAGMPILASKAAGAITAYVKPEYNGFLHEPSDHESVAEAMCKVVARTDAELWEMGRRSTGLADQITPETWAATLFELAHQS